MADVMKQVVQEVLQGNKTIVTSGADKQKTDSNKPSALKNIKRPNYQQMKRDQRLALNKNMKTERQNTKQSDKRSTVSLLPKQFNEASLSSLNSISLAQGKTQNNYKYPNARQKEGRRSRIIGNTRDGGCVWFFPDLDVELMAKFHRSLNNSAVGVVKMPDSLPSYVLLINETIRNNQDIKFHLSWDKEGGAFTAELYDANADRLGSIMNEIYQSLNRRSFKQHEIYTEVAPSSWLSRQLKIRPSADAIAILEGVSYYTGIILMDKLKKHVQSNDFHYEINRNHILLEGNYNVISNHIKALKKEADQLIKSDVII